MKELPIAICETCIEYKMDPRIKIMPNKWNEVDCKRCSMYHMCWAIVELVGKVGE